MRFSTNTSLRVNRLSSVLLPAFAATDAAFQPGQPTVATGRQSWQQVLELGQLDLDLALVRPCASREDVENQLRPVDDLDVRRLGDGPGLSRSQVAIDDDEIGLQAQGMDDQVL